MFDDSDEEVEVDELETKHKKSKMQMEEDLEDMDLLSDVKKRPVVSDKKTKSSGDDDITIGPDGRLLIKGISCKRKHEDDESDDEDEELEGNAHEPPPQTQGHSSWKYKEGGKGIHRKTKDKDLGATTGSSYASKKAKGDSKKKGQTVDPYAYYPLLKSSLNKRNKKKNQFKGLK